MSPRLLFFFCFRMEALTSSHTISFFIIALRTLFISKKHDIIVPRRECFGRPCLMSLLIGFAPSYTHAHLSRGADSELCHVAPKAEKQNRNVSEENREEKSIFGITHDQERLLTRAQVGKIIQIFLSSLYEMVKIASQNNKARACNYFFLLLFRQMRLKQRVVITFISHLSEDCITTEPGARLWRGRRSAESSCPEKKKEAVAVELIFGL